MYLEIPEEDEVLGSQAFSEKRAVARGCASAVKPLRAMIERVRRD